MIFFVFFFNSGELGVVVVEIILVYLDKLIDIKIFKNKLRDICKDMFYVRRVSSFFDCEYEIC